MKISIIIVNYNVKHYVYQCIKSVKRAIEGIDAEIYVVDNHSRDGSVDYLRHFFPDVNYVESNHNLGFARANNIAIRQSEGEYVLLLNPDTILNENVLRYSLQFMDNNPKAGGLGVRMIKCDGTDAMESRRGLPTPMTAFYKMCGLCHKFPHSHRYGHYYMSYLSWDEPAQIEVISGAYCFLRRAAIEKTGLLDEDFFMYGEDIDLSYRLLKAGYQNWYIPSPILHYKGESTQKSSFRYVHVFYEAMFIFFRKHYGSMSFWLSIPIKIAIYGKATSTLIRMQISRARKALGFFSMKHEKEPTYIFIGSSASIEYCKRLARNKGLTGQFYIGDKNTLPEGHISLLDKIDPNYINYVVYDTDSYSYKKILELFSLHPDSNIRIGTFDILTHTIITEEEIFNE